MKWGVRKDRSSGVTRIKRLAAPKKSATAKRKVKLLSDEELNSYIRRANLEKQYIELTTPKKSAGRKAIESVLSNSAKTIATKYVTKYLDSGAAAFERYLKRKSKR